MLDRDAIADLFSSFGPVSIRRMFSGFGVYCDGICFALHLRDVFYLKADDATIPSFESEGVRPFSYDARGKTVVIRSYWQMPERLYDDPDELAQWARRALDVARRAKDAKPKRRSKRAAAKTSKKPVGRKRA